MKGHDVVKEGRSLLSLEFTNSFVILCSSHRMKTSTYTGNPEDSDET